MALRDDQQLCNELFENLLIDHEFLLKMNLNFFCFIDM